MAESKKSFILYADYITTIEELTDEEAGKLIKHIFRYVNDKNPDPSTDRIVKLSFEPIKQQLKRDLKDWEKTKEARALSGKLGGIRSGEVRRKQNEANEANASKSKQNEANEAVNVNVTVNDNVIKKEKEKSFPSMPKAEDVGELPEVQINNAIELIKFTKQTDISKTDVVGLWKVFKTQNLTGKNYHPNLEAVHAYFINWIKSLNIRQKTRAPDKYSEPVNTDYMLKKLN